MAEEEEHAAQARRRTVDGHLEPDKQEQDRGLSLGWKIRLASDRIIRILYQPKFCQSSVRSQEICQNSKEILKFDECYREFFIRIAAKFKDNCF